MENIEGKSYLTMMEIAERLKVCRETVSRYVRNKRLDHIRIKGRVYIPEESYKSLFIPESQKAK